MDLNFVKYKYKFKNKLTLFFLENKIVFTICFLMILIGVILGICIAINYSGDVKLENLSNKKLLDFIKGDSGIWGIFFSNLMGFIFCVLFIIFTNYKPFLSVFTIFTLLIKGYLIAFDLTVLIILYGMLGIINVIIFIAPFEIVLLLIFIIISTMAIKQNFNLKKYGCGSYFCSNKVYLKNYYFTFIFLGCVLILIKCLFLPIIRVTIIVG